MAQPATDALHSVAILRYLGLSEEVAERVFEKWRGSPQKERERDVCEFAINCQSEYTYLDTGDDYRQALRAMGASAELAEQITPDGYEGIYETQTAWHWMKLAMTTRWEELEWRHRTGRMRGGTPLEDQDDQKPGEERTAENDGAEAA